MQKLFFGVLTWEVSGRLGKLGWLETPLVEVMLNVEKHDRISVRETENLFIGTITIA